MLSKDVLKILDINRDKLSRLVKTNVIKAKKLQNNRYDYNDEDVIEYRKKNTIRKTCYLYESEDNIPEYIKNDKYILYCTTFKSVLNLLVKGKIKELKIKNRLYIQSPLLLDILQFFDVKYNFERDKNKQDVIYINRDTNKEINTILNILHNNLQLRHIKIDDEYIDVNNDNSNVIKLMTKLELNELNSIIVNDTKDFREYEDNIILTCYKKNVLLIKFSDNV